jgi:hypothetical protein
VSAVPGFSRTISLIRVAGTRSRLASANRHAFRFQKLLAKNFPRVDSRLGCSFSDEPTISL